MRDASMIAATSSAARSDLVVHDHVVEPVAPARSPARPPPAVRRSSPRPRSRGPAAAAPAPPSTAGPGRSRSRRGTCARTCAAPLTSISRITSRPSASAAPRTARGVPDRWSDETSAHSRSSSVLDHPVELRFGDEEVVARRRPRRADAHGSSRRWNSASPSGSRTAGAVRRRFPSRPRRGPRGRSACRVAHGQAVTSCRTSSSSISRCLAPRPRTRRLAEMSSSSMIFWARTLPTPGSDSSTFDTFILPTMSSCPPLDSIVLQRSLAGLQLALQLRALLPRLGGLLEGFGRCSGVRSGSAMTLLCVRGTVAENAASIRTAPRRDTTRISRACGFSRAARVTRWLATTRGDPDRIGAHAVIGRPTTM